MFRFFVLRRTVENEAEGLITLPHYMFFACFYPPAGKTVKVATLPRFRTRVVPQFNPSLSGATAEPAAASTGDHRK